MRGDSRYRCSRGRERMAPLHHLRPRSQRVPITRPCAYEMSRFLDEKSVVFSQGDALAVNISTRGTLLLMPQVPDLKQVFDIRVPIAVKRVGLSTVVEARWTRQVPIDAAHGSMHFVGVKFLFPSYIAYAARLGAIAI
jgi:hypothetical protein